MLLSFKLGIFFLFFFISFIRWENKKIHLVSIISSDIKHKIKSFCKYILFIEQNQKSENIIKQLFSCLVKFVFDILFSILFSFYISFYCLFITFEKLLIYVESFFLDARKPFKKLFLENKDSLLQLIEIDSCYYIILLIVILFLILRNIK